MTVKSPGVPKSAYYVALDGLRAIAVIMVFFQHYGAGHAFLFGWGWTGVDLFFVLSGFLITGILYDNQHKIHRYRDFYIRRTLRIFPLYYFVWIVVLLIAPVAHWQWNTQHYVIEDDGHEVGFLSLDLGPLDEPLVIYEVFVPQHLRRNVFL